MAKPLAPDLSEFLPAPRPCAIGRALESLEPQDRVNLEAALGHPDVPMHKILHWLTARDLHPNETTVRRHRKGECPCGRA